MPSRPTFTNNKGKLEHSSNYCSNCAVVTQQRMKHGHRTITETFMCLIFFLNKKKNCFYTWVTAVHSSKSVSLTSLSLFTVYIVQCHCWWCLCKKWFPLIQFLFISILADMIIVILAVSTFLVWVGSYKDYKQVFVCVFVCLFSFSEPFVVNCFLCIFWMLDQC